LLVRETRQRWQNLPARLVVGGLLLLVTVAVLILDRYWAPWYPCLALATVAFGLLSSLELRQLFPEPRPLAGWMHTSVVLVLLANWYTPMGQHFPVRISPAAFVLLVASLMLLVGFVLEMARFRGTDGATQRLGLGTLALVWLGIAPSFLVQLRWFGWDPATASLTATDRGLWALAFAIFVPKVGDMAAYFGGTLLGRHRLAPILSPKKTWEGAVAGLIGSLLSGMGIAELCRQQTQQTLLNWPAALLASAAIGVIAQCSDLAESLVKRQRQVKDTSAYVPGLGGILDVVDSLLLSAPLSWLALHLLQAP